MYFKKLGLCLFFILSLASIAIGQKLLQGKVVAIADGDTFTLLTSANKQIKVRLYGVDCPEKNQDFGTRAKQFTSDQAFSKTITVEVKGSDRYGRTIGIARLSDGSVLNEKLLLSGLAWHYKHYDNSKLYAGLETEARKNRAGLWSMPDPVAPWEFRKSGRGKSSKSSSTQVSSSTQRSVSTTANSSICGAPTKTTGRPCQRVVRGGGYCWQHAG